nr:1904_t:CDS:10 [Entrophospora candida]
MSLSENLQSEHGYVIYNANIYTVEDDNESLPNVVDSLVVLKNIFVDVGSSSLILEKWKDFKHLSNLGESLLSVDLVEVRERIREYLSIRSSEKDSSEIQWIKGWGWDQTLWSSKLFPTHNDLDSDPILSKFSILLTRIDGHAVWVNKKTLDILQENNNLPEEIEGGEICRDKETNELTGIFIDNAVELIDKLVPLPSESTLFTQIKGAISKMHENGLTGVHDACVELRLINFFEKIILENPENFNIRNYAMVESPRNVYCGDQVKRIDGIGDGRLFVRSVKLVMDGALGSWGAALLEPYSDDPTKQGLLLSDPSLLTTVINQWIEKGFQVNTHCIGDKANQIIIDAYEKSFKDYIIKSSPNNSNELLEEQLKEEIRRLGDKLRFRIEHAQILTQKDIKRMGELNIIPSMQPTHATSDMSYAEQRLGPERIKGAYAWRSLINSGVKRFPLSSDFPIESVNPFLGFYSAITRKWTNGKSPHGEKGWFESECLTRKETLRGFTIDAAYAGFCEDILGSIKIGKYADFIVIDKDIMKIPEQEIPNIKVLSTIFNGNVVYEKNFEN